MNNLFGISEKSYRTIIQTISSFQDIDKTFLFGSRAKGNYKKGSDIDLAIYGKNLNQNTWLNLSVVLNEKTTLPYYFDIVAPKMLDNQNLIEHINRIGIVFYERT